MSERDSFELLTWAWRKEIDARLSGVQDSRNPRTLYQPMDYALAGKGKRIRPMLLLLACQAVGGKVGAAWDAAVAIELLHNFTLVHDDIMDMDDTRRGRPTLHRKWNADVALLAGDGLFALAYQALLRTRSPRIVEIANRFTDGVLSICEGQALDMEFESRAQVTPVEYLEMIQKKTATLLKVSAEIGGLIGEGSDDEVEALGLFAENLGYAFQVQDDLLDLFADEATLGKTHASDIKQGKRTFLIVHALSRADDEQRARLEKLLARREANGENENGFCQLFEELGSIAAATAAVDGFLLAAKNNLETLSCATKNAGLFNLIELIAKRKT